MTDVIPDTHILGKLTRDEELKRKFIDKIVRECYNLVIAPLESEYKVRIGEEELRNLALSFRTELRGKFVQERPPVPSVQCFKRGDRKLAGTAINRARRSGSTAIIVTEDPDFWRNYECFRTLRRQGVQVSSIEEFLSS